MPDDGLGASHQTGWPGLVATLIELYGSLDPEHALDVGKQAVFAQGALVHQDDARADTNLETLRVVQLLERLRVYDDHRVIYVQSFPALAERVRVSQDGGNLALWSPRRNELYYARAGEGQMMAVPSSTSCAVSRPFAEDASRLAPCIDRLPRSFQTAAYRSRDNRLGTPAPSQRAVRCPR